MGRFISNGKAPAWHGARGQAAADQALLELRRNLQPLQKADEERLDNLRQLMTMDDDIGTRVAEAICHALDTAHHYHEAAPILRYWLMFYSQDNGLSV